MSRTGLNKVAGRVLASARAASGLTQTRFLEALSERLGVRPYAQNALSSWEGGDRTVPAAVLIAAAELARPGGFVLTNSIGNEAKELPRMLRYLWVTAEMRLPRVATKTEQKALIASLLSAYNSRFKKTTEVTWSAGGGSAVISMAAGGYETHEITVSVGSMIRRNVAKGAAIVPEHAVDVSILSARPM